MEPQIKIWDFRDAPEHLQQKSISGGDEDLVILAAPNLSETAEMFLMTRILDYSYKEFFIEELPEGNLYIVDH